MSAIIVPSHLAEEQHAGSVSRRYSFVGGKGDLVIELHYGDFGTPNHRHEAALWLCRRGNPQAGVYVKLGDMWRFAERDALSEMVPPLARQIWGFVTKDDCFRLLDAIMDFMEDLKNSPPDPDMFKDRSLDAFMERCAQDGLDFFVERGGKRVVG